ncbi:MAG: PEGA domain-containing protein [Calditrichaeota bacterium]|nr:PEGA domain-containing protein [Candidatus Cloacimonadota bacterium]MCA9785313.1 PEGA domain-containing protein [Candidatus Cloacimonadota bacterium]MCB1048580.1 PEGA domain-containing protein [Calditrichota bacterium]MCB9474663.1 PEGA domain-containing protein [Candidatus Delongbacteria bacterium]
MSTPEEERIRREIRRELEEDERRRALLENEKQQQQQRLDEQRLRQQILAEEKKRLYENSRDHIEYVNENGDREWLTRKQILSREGYFDYEEHVEDIPGGRLRVIWSWSLGVVLLGLLVWLGWSYVQPDYYLLDVVCNVQGAEIWVDGQNSGSTTDARLELPAGEHFLEVRQEGYVSRSGLLHLELTRGPRQILSFELEPLPNVGADTP